MLNKDQIKSMLVFDLEACGQAHTLSQLKELNPRLAEIFERRTYPKIKDGNQTAEEAFLKNCSLYGEYGRVLCGSFGIIKFQNNLSDPEISVVSIAEDHEPHLLAKISHLMLQFEQSFSRSTYPGQLCGFNIKGWDIPFMAKRYIASKLQLPGLIDIGNKKPWEIPHYDLSDVWGFGQRKATPLELILATLDIPTSKDDIDGSEVHEVYHNAENKQDALKRISTYCDKDVIATCQLLLRLNGMDEAKAENITTKMI